MDNCLCIKQLLNHSFRIYLLHPQDQSFMSPGSPAKSAHHSPLKSSLQMQMQSPDKSGARGAAGSHSGAGVEAGATFIPFAQRQAKSQVAAREILKRGQKVSCFSCICVVSVMVACK